MGQSLHNKVVIISNFKDFVHCKGIYRYGKRGDCIKKSFKSSFLTKIAYRSHLVGLSFESDNMLDEVLSYIQALNIIVRLEDRGAWKQQLLPAVNFTQAQKLYMTITQVR